MGGRNYSVYSKCRKKCKRRSGGIAIVYKKSFSIFLNFLNSESEYVQWVEFYKDVFGPCDKGLLHSNFLLGCVHLPPGSSKLSSEEAFIEIENEMIRLVKVCLQEYIFSKAYDKIIWFHLQNHLHQHIKKIFIYFNNIAQFNASSVKIANQCYIAVIRNR
jgi:hypothetical protein